MKSVKSRTLFSIRHSIHTQWTEGWINKYLTAWWTLNQPYKQTKARDSELEFLPCHCHCSFLHLEMLFPDLEGELEISLPKALSWPLRCRRLQWRGTPTRDPILVVETEFLEPWPTASQILQQQEVGTEGCSCGLNSGNPVWNGGTFRARFSIFFEVSVLHHILQLREPVMSVHINRTQDTGMRPWLSSDCSPLRLAAGILSMVPCPGHVPTGDILPCRGMAHLEVTFWAAAEVLLFLMPKSWPFCPLFVLRLALPVIRQNISPWIILVKKALFRGLVLP